MDNSINRPTKDQKSSREIDFNKRIAEKKEPTKIVPIPELTKEDEEYLKLKEEIESEKKPQKKFNDIKQKQETKNFQGKKIDKEEIQKLKEKKAYIIIKEVEKSNENENQNQGKKRADEKEPQKINIENNIDETKRMPEKETDDDEKTELLKIKIKYPSLTNIKSGEQVIINKPYFRIGKSRQNNDYVIEGNKSVSRNHLAILGKNEKFYIKDNHSTNGTFVNGYKIPPDTEMEIKDKQLIKISNEEFKFEI